MIPFLRSAKFTESLGGKIYLTVTAMKSFKIYQISASHPLFSKIGETGGRHLRQRFSSVLVEKKVAHFTPVCHICFVMAIFSNFYCQSV